MYSFLVLGLIPGTNIQISFQAWLVIMPVLLVSAVLLRSPLRKLIELGKAAAPHEAMDANLLHHRLQHTAR